MAILTVTADVGGSTKPLGGLYVPPGRDVLDAGAATRLFETGLDPSFTADLLSAALMHERCGVHLYRSAAGRTTNEAFRAQYEEFGRQTERHVEILEGLIAGAGGDPMYVSPAARLTEKGNAGLLESTFMLSGSIDLDSAELAVLEAVLLAEAKDHGNWDLMRQLGEFMAAGDLRDAMVAAVDEVLAQEEEHYGWAEVARAELLYARATGGQPLPMPDADVDGAGEPVVDLTAATKDELYEAAKELGIEGRSNMTKDELAHAIEEQA